MKNGYLRKIASVILAALLVLSACGQSGDGLPAPAGNGARSADIELQEPLAASIGTEKVTYRNLYDYEVLTGTVYPETWEYSFSQNVTLERFLVFPGQEVSKGTLLAKADTTAIDRQIKDLKERIDDLNLSYGQSRGVAELQLAHEVWYIETRQQQAGTDAELALDVQRAIFHRDRLQQKMDNDQALYELDLAYLQAQLAQLQRDRAKRLIYSDRDGIVTAIAETGPNVREKTAVIALSDEGKKIFKCDYRSEKEMSKISRYYLVAEGKTYDLQYLPYTAEEYSKRLAAGEKVYSNFEVLDEEGTLELGCMGTLVLITDERHGVLSVSDSALHRDTGGYYANRVKDGHTEKVYVERGMLDGNFTEVLSGLEAGDQVLLSDYLVESTGRHVLERGDYVVPYEGQGYVTYPDKYIVSNEIEYGAVTMTELLVKANTIVKKGDPIARVSVQGDEIALQEQERKLQRLTERRAEAQKAYDAPATAYLSEAKQKQMENQIASFDRQIEQTAENIEKIRRCYRTTSITSPVDGVVLSVTELSNGALLESGEYIATMAADRVSLLRVANSRGVVRYGMPLTISYVLGDKDSTLSGEVVSLSDDGLSASLRNEHVWVREESGLIRELSLNGDGENEPVYFQRLAYALYGYEEVEHDVVLVPMKAVTVIKDRAYVQVLEEDGNVVMQGFIPGNTGIGRIVTLGGGSDNMTWAVEGLEEGMTICWQ
ncbi:MAG: hypothetical protein K6E92_03680 [Lachnospiraceae bacterium]|nr:hypothetical protein [Lachnospiraceae bacterium]